MAVSPTEITRSQADYLALQLVSARIGAAFYVVWGVLHLIAARGICELASSIPDGPAHARLEQGGLNLGLFAVQTMAVAVLLNWHNNRIGFWLNIIVIGAVDIGYVNAADRTRLLPRVVRRARRPDRLCDWCNVFDRWFVAPRFGSVEQ